MYIAVIDIGGSFIKFGLVDGAGQLSEKGKTETPKSGFDAMAAALISIVETLKGRVGEVSGIALSIPAPVDVVTGVIHGAGSLPFLLERNLKAALEAHFELPVSCENDGNCAALAEVWAGAAKAYQDVVLIVCGTGIGGAIVKNRQIHHGKHLFAGEFGYGIHHFDMRSGDIEIWSLKASMGSLVQRTAKRLALSEEALNGEMVFAMAAEGNAMALEEIEDFYMGMAVGIHNIQYYYDPELILLGGAVSGRESFVPCIEEKLAVIYDKLGHPRAKPLLKVCQFQNDANLIGAYYHFQRMSQYKNDK